MVFQLLSSRGTRAEQRSARQEQILSLFIHFLVDEEIFLLGAYGRGDLVALDAEQPQDSLCLRVERLHGFQKRRLFVERLALVGYEYGGNVKGSLFDECGRGRIPCGIAARRAGRAGAAGRKGGCVGFADDQAFSRKLHNDLAAVGRLDKAVVLFGSQVGKRLEPVGVVSGALRDRPILHCLCHGTCDRNVDRRACFNRLLQGFVNFLRKGGTHDRVVEYVRSENCGYVHVYVLLQK